MDFSAWVGIGLEQSLQPYYVEDWFRALSNLPRKHHEIGRAGQCVKPPFATDRHFGHLGEDTSFNREVRIRPPSLAQHRESQKTSKHESSTSKS